MVQLRCSPSKFFPLLPVSCIIHRHRFLTSIRMASTLPKLPLFEAIANHDPNSTAIVHSLSGRNFTYGELLRDVADSKDNLKKTVNGKDLAGERIAFLIENGYDYVGANSRPQRRPCLLLMCSSNITFHFCESWHCCAHVSRISTSRAPICCQS